MPRVFIPPAMRSLTQGQTIVEATGESVMQIIEDLERKFPGFKNRVCQNDTIRPGLSVVVNGSASALGTLQRVQPADEIHFLPAIGGG